MYLNNAATSYPKPPEVSRAIVDCLHRAPAASGRGAGGDCQLELCRRRLGEFVGVTQSRHLCFAASGTDALNTAIFGSVAAGTEVVSTDFDHNSVSRPLTHLRLTRGVRTRRVALNSSGNISLKDIEAALTRETSVVVLTHVSNVTGAVIELQEIVEGLAERRLTIVVDASQSLGVLEVDLAALPGRIVMAAAAHKGLYAPAGLGVLAVPDDKLEQRVHGGTGVRSEEAEHPRDLPLRHESGTPNHLGIAGLDAGVNYLMQHGLAKATLQRSTLVRLVRSRLAAIAGVDLSPLPDEDGRAGIVAFRVHGKDSNEVGHLLDRAFDIQVRSGLHCAPSMHRALGTEKTGLVRASFGGFNSESDALSLVDAVERIARD